MANSESNSEPWHYRGEFVQACNCDWGCPCEFNQPPTTGYCEGGWAINITQGVSGTTKLDGVKFAMFAKWPKQVYEGGGTAGIYIDETASSEQRDALMKILTGKAGGLPWSIIATTIDTWLDPKNVAFEWKFNGVHSRFKAGPYAHATLEPMRNPVTGSESAARIVVPQGFIYKEAEISSTASFAVLDKGLRYAYPGKNASITIVNHSN